MAVTGGTLDGVSGFGIVYGNKCLAFIPDDGKVRGGFKTATELDSVFREMSADLRKVCPDFPKFKQKKDEK